MKTLTIAALLSLLSLFTSACSGGGSLPSVTTPVIKHHHSPGGVKQSTCPGDGGGGLTGDHPCNGMSNGQG